MKRDEKNGKEKKTSIRKINLGDTVVPGRKNKTDETKKRVRRSSSDDTFVSDRGSVSGDTKIIGKGSVSDETKVFGKNRRSSMDETKVFRDLPLNDGEDFEFHPDYDSINLFGDEFFEPEDFDSYIDPEEVQKSEGPSKRGRRSEAVFPDHSGSEHKQETPNRRIQKLQPEEPANKKEVRKKRRSQNREILMISYAFSALFILMIGYFVYFNAFVSKDVINSAYNVRVDSFSDSIIRGDILSSDGEILAETLRDDDGNEIRNYPYGRIFSHVVGTSDINQSGIELSENFYMLQSNGNPITNILRDIRGEKNQGDQIISTLDTTLQEAAYNALGNNDGAVVAIEPSTGRILAMVSKPDYDPNTLVEDYDYIVADEDNHSLMNKATFGRFIPGSIFKTMTALAFIRSGEDYENYTYNCEGQINLGGEEYITCFNGNVHGEEDFEDSFAYSCNSSFGNIGLMLPDQLLKNTCESMYFNKKLPGNIPHLESYFKLASDDSDWVTAATAIGQGHTQVTPFHMASLAATIANGGNMMQPYMVDSVQTADGGRRVKKYLPVSEGQIMTTEEAATIGSLMEAVVDYGTATSLAGYGYSVAGKTGTAEVDGKGDNSWFIGYAPVEQPQIAICVLVENDPGYYESALPVANAVLQSHFNE